MHCVICFLVLIPTFPFGNNMLSQIFKVTLKSCQAQTCFWNWGNAIKIIYALNYAHNSYQQQWEVFECRDMNYEVRWRQGKLITRAQRIGMDQSSL